MIKITDIEQIEQGCAIINSDDQICHVANIKKRAIEIKPYQLRLFSSREYVANEFEKTWFENQEERIKESYTNPTEHCIEVQLYPNKKWYIANVKCDKCSGEAKLRFTSTTAEKFICTHQIQKGENTYNCGGKKFTEVSRKHTGVPCKNTYLWSDFVKEFKLCQKEKN